MKFRLHEAPEASIIIDIDILKDGDAVLIVHMSLYGRSITELEFPTLTVLLLFFTFVPPQVIMYFLPWPFPKGKPRS